MIHGGAGELDRISNSDDATPWLDSIHTVLECGRDILEQNGSALDTVETCAAMLEDNQLFNAGRGSVLNNHGKVENDAAIMDGRNFKAGSVAGITGIKNPVKLARLVLATTEHVMLVGDGAMQFAIQSGIDTVTDDYLITDYRRAQYEKIRNAGHLVLDLNTSKDVESDHGTIGAVAWDCAGNLAAATSTGGMLNKMRGRVGDSPVIGAGIFADNRTCAISGSGCGEDFIRTVLAKHIASLIEFRHLDAIDAVRQGIDYLVNRVNGRGGVIIIDRNGHCASGFSTKTMIHGYIEHSGEIKCSFRNSFPG